MKITGLIAEYNPFHNGHLYHIQETKQVTGADAVIVVMSGDYVQRGVPAIMPKRIRAEMALRCGASAVFELPVCYATGSAELFAMGAVSFLDRLGIVDSICFGSECNDLRAMNTVADLLLKEPAEYRNMLKENLRSGCSYPAARQKAVFALSDNAELLKDPNNILGIEYLKALKKLNSPIRPYTIRRKGAHYHDQTFSEGQFSSASAIRSLLAYSGSTLNTDQTGGSFEDTAFSGILSELEGQVPPYCLELLKDWHHVQYPVYLNDFSLILKYKLLNKQPDSLVRYADVSEDLAARIYARLNDFFNYRQFCELLKTRETTQTRINRALLHIMLGIKKDKLAEYSKNGFHFYARLLGIRKDSEKILARAAKESSVPLIARLSDSSSLPQTARKMLRNDLLASNLYMSVVTDKYKTAFQNEYKQALLKV
ncbi:MAG TPA: nucleotidyltransferase [Candidatus Mediterraneibacter excrementavium]|nr:nucleotidyltransferase [Candidatus Mediterraneibacter excrementavium]